MFESHFAAADQELAEKEREFRIAAKDLAAQEKAFAQAQAKEYSCRQEWQNAGMRTVPYAELHEAWSRYDEQEQAFEIVDRSFRQLKTRLRYCKRAKALRDLSARLHQPWYVLSTIGGAIAFALATAIAFFWTDSLAWIFGSASCAFVVGFAIPTVYQRFPNDKELRQIFTLEPPVTSKWQSLKAARDKAKAAYDGIYKLSKLKDDCEATGATLAACTESRRRANEKYQRLKLAYDTAREKCSRRNRLLALDWKSFKGTDFETFLVEVFRELAYQVETTRVTGDHGVDLILSKAAHRIAIQAKGYPNTSVGNSAIQEAYSGMAIYKCSRCAVVTNSYFTAHARDAASRLNCLLIEQAQIEDLVRGKIPDLN